jgi:YVTN family beta-propeller protein
MFQNFGPFAYVANVNGGSVSVIDLGTESEIATFNTGGDPYWAAISANGSVVAVTLHDVVDATGAVTESNEGNNTIASGVVVQVSRVNRPPVSKPSKGTRRKR